MKAGGKHPEKTLARMRTARRAGMRRLITKKKRLLATFQKGDICVKEIIKEYHVSWFTIDRFFINNGITSKQRRAAYIKWCKKHVCAGFQKGHVPFFKGKKGIHISPKTEFKPGHHSARAQPIGTISLRHDGCAKRLRGIRVRRPGGSGPIHGKPRQYIKVSEVGRWIPLARYIWLEAGKSIPRGYIVVHFDGNAMNCSLDNLRCVTRAESLKLRNTRDPEADTKFRAESRKTLVLRHRKEKEIRKFHGKKVWWWECTSCSNDIHSYHKPDRCTKCGCHQFIHQKQRVKQ